jgi:hypothetical protein
MTNTQIVRNASLVLALMAGGACTTIRSQPVAPTSPEAADGFVYYLPLRTLHIEAKYVIADCGYKTDTQTAVLLYDVLPTVTSSLIADRRRPLVISDGLSGKALKALTYEIALYENGTLKSFNATADDRTAETATNVISGALKFGLGFTGLGLFSADDAPKIVWLRDLTQAKLAAEAAAAAKKPNAKPKGGKGSAQAPAVSMEDVQRACGPRLSSALIRYHTLSAKIDGAHEATEAKAKLTAAVANAEKAVTDARAALKAAKEVGGTEDVALAQTTLTTAVSKLADARKKAEASGSATAPTTLTQQMALIVQRDLTFSAAMDFVPTETPADTDKTLSYPAASLKAQGIQISDSDDLTANVQLKLLFAPVDGAASDEKPVHQLAKGPRNGIFVRTPASALLRVCVKSCSDDTARLSQTITVPQWGQLSVFPLKNLMFSKSSTKLAFAPDGTITNLNFESTAAAERASGAFASSGELFLDFVTKRRELVSQLADAETAREKAGIQKQIDLLDLQRELADAKAGTAPDRQKQLDQIQFEIDKAKKEEELLEARQALEKRRSGGSE